MRDLFDVMHIVPEPFVVVHAADHTHFKVAFRDYLEVQGCRAADAAGFVRDVIAPRLLTRACVYKNDWCHKNNCVCRSARLKKSNFVVVYKTPHTDLFDLDLSVRGYWICDDTFRVFKSWF